jgi:hypothetical protein
MIYEFQVTTDHFQLLFGDSEHGPDVDTTNLWRENNNRVASIPPYIVGLPTIRYGGKTKVQVEVTDAPPLGKSSWQPIGDFALEVPSGQVVFWGPELVDLSQARYVTLPAGSYAGIVLARGRECVKDEMADEGADEYRIVLWRRQSGNGPREEVRHG